MFEDRHIIKLTTNFYITFSALDKNPFDSTRTIEDIIDSLNRNELVNIGYNGSTIREFTDFISDIMENHLRIKKSEERLHICALNGILIDPLRI
jgi:nucleoside-diphosphate-sugar epimerase